MSSSLKQERERLDQTTIVKSALALVDRDGGHIRWQKFPNATFKKLLDELVTKRNQIAHGNKQGTAQLGQLRRWKNMVTVYSSRLEAVVAGHIETVTGSAPNW